MVALKTFGMDAGQAHLAPHVLIIHRTTIYIIVVVVYHTTHMSHSPRLLAFLPPRHFLRRVSVPPCSGGGTLGPMPRGKAPPQERGGCRVPQPGASPPPRHSHYPTCSHATLTALKLLAFLSLLALGRGKGKRTVPVGFQLGPFHRHRTHTADIGWLDRYKREGGREGGREVESRATP